MRIFRWSGIVVFLSLLLLIWLIATITLPFVARYLIEDLGTKAWGARVEVRDTAINWFPLGFRLEGLTIADKDKEMNNLVSFEYIDAHTLLLPLTEGRVVVSSMLVEGLEFGTQRTSSGWLSTTETAENAPQGLDQKGAERESVSDIVAGKLPSVDEILDREPLLTLELGQKLEQSWKSGKAEIEASIDQLPDAAKLKSYEQRIKEIVEGKIKSLEDFQTRKSALDMVLAELKADKQELKTLKEQVQEQSRLAKQSYAELKRAPQEDYQRLMRKYGFDAQGAINLTSLLLGSEWATYLQEAYRYYRLLAPMLNSGEQPSEPGQSIQSDETGFIEAGRFISFAKKPEPDLWIQEARLTYLSADQEDWVLALSDLSHQAERLDEPLRIRLSEVDGNKQVQLNASLDRRGKEAQDQLDLSLGSWPVSAQQLEGQALQVSNALGNFSLQASRRGERLDGDLLLDLHDMSWTVREGVQYAQSLNKALSSMDQLKVQGELGGSVRQPVLDLHSDMQDKLNGVLSSLKDEATSEIKTALKSRLDAKLAAYAGPYQSYLSELNEGEVSLDQLDNKLSELLETKLASYEDQAKEKLQNKLNDKLKKLF